MNEWNIIMKTLCQLLQASQSLSWFMMADQYDVIMLQSVCFYSKDSQFGKILLNCIFSVVIQMFTVFLCYPTIVFVSMITR